MIAGRSGRQLPAAHFGFETEMKRNPSEVAHSKAMIILPVRTAVAIGVLTTIGCLFAPFSLRKTKMQTRQVNLQRWSITSQKPFDAVVAAVEEEIGRPNMVEFVAKMTAATSYDEMQKVVHDSVSEIGLMEFMRLDHGAVLRKAGGDGNRKSVRLIVGNPLIMQSMTRLVPDAGSYAPVTVLIDQRPDGVHLSYDEMASVLAPYGNAEALKIARDLDAKVKRLLKSAS
jgi:uncharacterized protein (DUF302 family)